jgi:hypothetical protein
VHAGANSGVEGPDILVGVVSVLIIVVVSVAGADGAFLLMGGG